MKTFKNTKQTLIGMFALLTVVFAQNSLNAHIDVHNKKISQLMFDGFLGNTGLTKKWINLKKDFQACSTTIKNTAQLDYKSTVTKLDNLSKKIENFFDGYANVNPSQALKQLEINNLNSNHVQVQGILAWSRQSIYNEKQQDLCLDTVVLNRTIATTNKSELVKTIGKVFAHFYSQEIVKDRFSRDALIMEQPKLLIRLIPTAEATKENSAIKVDYTTYTNFTKKNNPSAVQMLKDYNSIIAQNTEKNDFTNLFTVGQITLGAGISTANGGQLIPTIMRSIATTLGHKVSDLLSIQNFPGVTQLVKSALIMFVTLYTFGMLPAMGAAAMQGLKMLAIEDIRTSLTSESKKIIESLKNIDIKKLITWENIKQTLRKLCASSIQLIKTNPKLTLTIVVFALLVTVVPVIAAPVGTFLASTFGISLTSINAILGAIGLQAISPTVFSSQQRINALSAANSRSDQENNMIGQLIKESKAEEDISELSSMQREAGEVPTVKASKKIVTEVQTQQITPDNGQSVNPDAANWDTATEEIKVQEELLIAQQKATQAERQARIATFEKIQEEHAIEDQKRQELKEESHKEFVRTFSKRNPGYTYYDNSKDKCEAQEVYNEHLGENSIITTRACKKEHDGTLVPVKYIDGHKGQVELEYHEGLSTRFHAYFRTTEVEGTQPVAQQVPPQVAPKNAPKAASTSTEPGMIRNAITSITDYATETVNNVVDCATNPVNCANNIGEYCKENPGTCATIAAGGVVKGALVASAVTPATVVTSPLLATTGTVLAAI